MAIDYKASSEISRQALVRAGLTPHQSAIYEALIHYGPQKATKIAFLAGVPRTLSYKVLAELEAQGLISRRDEPGAVSIFTPAHPLALKELAKRRLEDAEATKRLMEEALPGLISGFDALLGTLPEARLYARVALYAGKAGLGALSASERSALEETLRKLLNSLEK